MSTNVTKYKFSGEIVKFLDDSKISRSAKLGFSIKLTSHAEMYLHRINKCLTYKFNITHCKIINKIKT